MSDPARKSKKRKSTAQDVAVEVSMAESSTGSGPVFVNFPSIRPAKTTPFTAYTRTPQSDLDITKQRTLVAGETEDVEFYSTNRDFQHGGEGSDCQYLPAIYDPATNSLTIHPSTPLYLMTHRVKRMNAEAARAAASQPNYKQKRNDLGETFGTRKAKTQIRAEERNRVDVAAMEGIKGQLMGSIIAKAPVSEIVAASESIPVPNLTTLNPMDVYPRESLIPDDEYNAISVSAIAQAPDDRARAALLPWSRGRWLEGKMRSVLAGPREQRRHRLKYIYYISSLHHLLFLGKKLEKLNATEIQQKCSGMPVQVLSGMLSRFAEPTGKHFAITEKTRAKALAWICCLCLMLGDGTVEVGKVAKDLSMTDAKVGTIFKSLGCAVDVMSVADREKQGLSLQDAQANKRAVLKAPVKFPKIGRRGPVKR